MGQSISDAYGFWKKEPNSHVLTGTDALGFMKFFLQRVANADESEAEKVLRQIMVPQEGSV